MMQGKIRILVVDSRPIFREGVSMIIAGQSDMSLVAQAGNSAQAIEEFLQHRPDITLMDQRLPGPSGTETLISIRNQFQHARIIILTDSDGDVEIQQALKAGAAAYLLKTIPRSELLDTIRQVHQGRRSIHLQIASKLAEHLGSETLTPREMDVLQLIRDGFRNKQIADRLSIAETTVSFHIKNVIDKLEGNDRTHAVTIALKRGLLQL